MIAAVTPGVKRSLRVTRKNIAEVDVTALSKVDIVQYRFAKSALQGIKFKDIALFRDLTTPADVDILWEISFQFKQQQANWQGMMHLMHKGHTHPGKSSITFLPMIDMAPGDRTCIVSTLHFILKVAEKHQFSAVVTFDQPLYWKASEVIQAEPTGSPLKDIVLLLGSFHTVMNVLGAIGTLMDGTGLRNILEEVYAENAVVHMLSGKAVARAVRGHLLVDNCLHQLLLNSIAEDTPDFAALIDETEEAYQRLLQRETDFESFLKSAAVTRIQDELEKKRSEVHALSKTKLPETWADMREPLLEGMGFTLKYLGMTLVEKPKGEDMAAAAIHRIIATARVGPKKFQKVILTVSPRGLSLQDAETKETIESVSIYRISYCTTDKLQNKVFAYVAQNPQSGALECHAFLSPKKKIAHAVTLTVAQAFQVALDLWEAAQAGPRQEHPLRTLCPMDIPCQPARPPVGSPPFKASFKEEEDEDDEEEEEEEGDLGSAFSGCSEEGGSPTTGLPLPAFCTPPVGMTGVGSPQEVLSRLPAQEACVPVSL
ncbi:hypothetical protein lerEdw1_015410 [Lerista edwardsae]|nr:hypothetical protein lerEdw1_015410 [Lerista edwardsae]